MVPGVNPLRVALAIREAASAHRAGRALAFPSGRVPKPKPLEGEGPKPESGPRTSYVVREGGEVEGE